MYKMYLYEKPHHHNTRSIAAGFFEPTGKSGAGEPQ